MKITSKGGCDNYPRCGHLYPDCIDLTGLLQRYRIDDEGYKQSNEGVSYEEFHICARWIMENRLRNGNRKWEWVSSYALKHIVEAETHTYIPNGAFIAAGILLGIRWRYKRGPNVGFFLPPQHPSKRIRKAQEQANQ